jgi:TetR/AcrR family transcriptional repressor of nem operon
MSPATAALTKQAILAASIHLMQRKGFAALGMRDIAQSLKIKAPSLYHHFPSKEALAQQALEQYRLDQRRHLQELAERKTLAQRLAGYVTLFSKMLEDDARLCLFLVISQERASVSASCIMELRLFIKQNTEWLETTLQSAATRRSSMLSARETAEVLFGAFEGLMMTSLCDRVPARIFLARAKNLLRAMGLLSA